MDEKNRYVPHPADVSRVQLPADLLELAELIAENVHEVWAESRLREGWTYGPERNDLTKKHPGLVPYAELSETEKDYDRHTALDTLKLLVKMGYEIKRTPESGIKS